MGEGWVVLQAYNLLVDITRFHLPIVIISVIINRWEGRGEARLLRMLEEKPEKLMAALLVEEKEVRMAKERVEDLVVRKGNLLKIHRSCDHDLLARACNSVEGRQVILKLVAKALDSVNTVGPVGEVIASLVTNPHNLEPRLLMEELEGALSHCSHFVKSELLNFLIVKLKPIKTR